MKQLLLLAVIHLLIFHQYKKDKSEVLAPGKNNRTVKTGKLLLSGKQDYLFGGIVDNTNNIGDSLLSRHSGSLRPDYMSYSSWTTQIYKNK